MIHCAICYHDGKEIYKTVYCALLSCFMNTKEKIHVHILSDDTVENGRKYLEELCAQYNQDISFYDSISVPSDIINIFPNGRVGNYTSASLYRFCLHEVIPQDIEKIIYVDFDVIFEKDIAELWNQPLGSAYCVAAHDAERKWSSRKKSYYLKALGILEERYFNSGVLLINLRALRDASKEQNIFWKSYRENKQFFSKLKFPVFDQDLMNFMLSSDYEKLRLIDSSFNYELCLFDRRFLKLHELKGKILHFPALKPWQKFFPAQLIYWKYFSLSPWGNDTMQLIEERIFDKKDRIWPLLLAIWKRHTSFRWLNALISKF